MGLGPVRHCGWVAVLLGAVLGGGCRRAAETGAGHDAARPRPNIVIYLIDTMRRDHVGVYGYERNTTPRMDELAQDAVVFEEAYAPSGWTKPSVGTVLSGVNPPRHGAITRSHALPEDVKVLGEYLSPLGYHTAAIVTNPNIIPFWGFDQGFDTFYDVREETRTRRVNADTVTEWTIRHLAQAIQSPWFLYIHTMDPHSPYEPPAPYDAMFTDDPAKGLPSPAGIAPDTPEDVFHSTVARYDAEIAFNDAQFGLLMDYLKQQGLYQDALIIVVADHGEEFLDHEEAGHGHTLYQELVHIPMMIKWPGNEYGGSRARFRSGLIDVVPTVLSYLGAELPAELEGMAVLPLLSGAAPADPNRVLYFDLDLVRANGGALNVSQAVLAGAYKYVEVASPEERCMLFDLGRDPEEKSNLFGDDSAVVRRLDEQLNSYVADSTAGLHLRLVNEGGTTDRVVEGLLKTDGHFVAVREVQLEEGDQAVVDATGQKITFRFTLYNCPHPTGGKPKWLVDEDQLSFEVSPAGAEVRVERLVNQEGETLPLFVGLAKRRVEVLPVGFKRSDPALAAPSINALFRKHGVPRYNAPMGGYLVSVSAARRQEVDQAAMPPELRKALEDLGYLEKSAEQEGPGAVRDEGQER